MEDRIIQKMTVMNCTNEVLLDALFEGGNIEYIARALMFKRSKNITKETFLKGAQMVVDSKDIELITEFATHCFGEMDGFGNSYNIIDEYINMLAESNDKQLINNIIKYISNAQKWSNKENIKSFFDCLFHGELEDIKTGEYISFDCFIPKEAIKFKRLLKGIRIKSSQFSNSI